MRHFQVVPARPHDIAPGHLIRSYHTGHTGPRGPGHHHHNKETHFDLNTPATGLRPASEICLSISAVFWVEVREESCELFLFAIISCVWELIIEGEIWCNVISVVSYPRNGICIFLQNDFQYLFFSPPPKPSHIPDVHHLHHSWLVSHLSDWSQPPVLQSYENNLWVTIRDHTSLPSQVILDEYAPRLYIFCKLWSKTFALCILHHRFNRRWQPKFKYLIYPLVKYAFRKC